MPVSKGSSSSAPKGRRPGFPKAYGVKKDTKDLLRWSHVEERMAAAKHYWVSTVDAEGAPHARPVDGIWLEGRLFFGGSPETKWLKNVRANPSVCLHLESADDVVILHGDVETIVPDAAFAKRLAEASTEKYGFSVPVEAYQQGVNTLRVERAYAWTELPRDATRWDLEPDS